MFFLILDSKFPRTRKLPGCYQRYFSGKFNIFWVSPGFWPSNTFGGRTCSLRGMLPVFSKFDHFSQYYLANCSLIHEQHSPRCESCGWPVCSLNCEGIKDPTRHAHECLILGLRSKSGARDSRKICYRYLFSLRVFLLCISFFPVWYLDKMLCFLWGAFWCKRKTRKSFNRF